MKKNIKKHTIHTEQLESGQMVQWRKAKAFSALRSFQTVQDALTKPRQNKNTL
jgi:hypothetical protein